MIIDPRAVEARYQELTTMDLWNLGVEIDSLTEPAPDLGWPTEDELIRHILSQEFGDEALVVVAS